MVGISGEAGLMLDVLLDVEMPVTIRVGSTSLLLRDAAALAPGSALELRRALDDPVDVLVNGRVVARGVMVLVNGNYGVRITEVTRENA
jgi:flagellar motor switch protein FliN/FliY